MIVSHLKKPKDFLRKITNKLKKNGQDHILGVIPFSDIRSYLPNDPIIAEAGAHIGIDTMKMAKLWPSGTIHAFEPIPHLFSKLKENTCNFSNIKCYPWALSKKTGSSKMFSSSGSSDGSSSLLAPKEHLNQHPDVFFSETIQVQTITLDDWAKQCGIKKVDFLWLDLQGFELPVLKAASQILRRVQAVYSEVNLIENYSGCALYSELRSWMEKFGFKVKLEALTWSDGGNVFFCRE